jgi:hypothetical protein
MIKTVLLSVLVYLTSCQPRQYSILRDFKPLGKSEIPLDKSFQFYVREIYRDSSEQKFSLSSEIGKQLVEIEYLLYSDVHERLIYITTVPDKYQDYYAQNRLPNEILINAFDFNTFHLGKLFKDKNEIVFRDIKDSSTLYKWQFKKSEDFFSIERILETKNDIYQNERSVINSIHYGAIFRRISSFEIVFKDFKKPDVAMLELSQPLIYLSHHRRKYDIYLSFNDLVPTRNFFNLSSREKKITENRSKNQYSTILFSGKKRMPFDPSFVLEY